MPEIIISSSSKLENDENTNLNLTTLFELAKGLGVHPKELIDYEFDFLKKEGSSISMAEKELIRIKKLFGTNLKKTRGAKDFSLLEVDYV